MTMMMDHSGIAGGCCVTRYDTEKMDRIMLRFRPIAPKPTTPGASTHGRSSLENTSRVGGSRKRRSVNNNSVQKNSSSKRSKTASPEALTLTLLPETSLKRPTSNSPIWLNFNSGTAEKDDHPRSIFYAPDPTVVIPPRVKTGTCITLECLTYTMVDVDALGQTDKERVMNLEWDTCPGLVSDRLSQVTWWNAAFSKIVNDDNRGSGRCYSSRAWVAMKESVPISTRAFSCRVRVEVEVETDNKVMKKRRMTVPCDVWRMDCGGFAWRLDVKAALSLG